MQDDLYLYCLTAVSEKGDLAQFLHATGRTLSATQAAKYVLRPLLRAVSRMHERGLIHRDIKPENLLMNEDNTVMLGDFDLSIDAMETAPVSKVGSQDTTADVLELFPLESKV